MKTNHKHYKRYSVHQEEHTNSSSQSGFSGLSRRYLTTVTVHGTQGHTVADAAV